VSLLDLYPFIVETVGAASPQTITPDHPGASIHRLAGGSDADRVVFSECHGMGSKTGAYMVRKGPLKLVYYADYAPQLFDLGADPGELDDLADTAPGQVRHRGDEGGALPYLRSARRERPRQGRSAAAAG
jgi:choline-sulfatase